MARSTFNRRPVGVNTPNSNDIKQNYFNHFNWKGINQNENFLLVDQETFSDAKNVYVDDKGLLKSRLCFKFVKELYNKNIKDIKVFDDIAVCVYVNADNEWYIGIMNNDEWIIDYKFFEDYPLKAFRNGEYIYIFTNEKIITYIVKDKIITDADLYEPITRRYLFGTYEENEPENVFSCKERYSYLLNSSVNNDFQISENAYGKELYYYHNINDEVVRHDITLTKEVAVPLIHDTLTNVNFEINAINYYGTKVPTVFINNNDVYRYDVENGLFLKASISDLNFSIVLDIKNYIDTDLNTFVKVKMHQSGDVTILFTRMLITLALDETVSIALPVLLSADDLMIDTNHYHINGTTYVDCLYFKKGENEQYGVVLYCDDIGKSILYHAFSSGYDKETLKNTKIKSDLSASNYRSYRYYTSCGISFYDNLKYCDLIIRNKTSFYTFDGVISFSTTDIAETYGVDYYSHSKTNFYTDCDVYPSVKLDLTTYGEPRFSGLIEKYENDENRIYYGSITWLYGKINFANFIEGISGSTYLYNGTLFELNVSPSIISNSGERIFINTYEYEIDFSLMSNSLYWFYHIGDSLLSNYRKTSMELFYVKERLSEYKLPTVFYFDNNIYFAIDNVLYMGEIVRDLEDDKEKLYFKELNIFNENINGFHKINDDTLAIFLTNNSWYFVLSDLTFKQSKIIPSLKNKSDIITLQDSTTTLMPSENGIIALSYQNFVSTSEQSTVNLTQNLTSLYNVFKSDLKALNWKNYTLFYENSVDAILIYDNRYYSWWYWKLPEALSTLFVYDNCLYAISNGFFYKFENSPNSYYDSLKNTDLNIDWYIESQKLHLNANNYYKHISNLTFSSVQDGDEPMSLNLNVKNYRKWVDNGKAENFDYHVDIIRTYVKRVNYAKVCEFQYRLSSDDMSAINVPLSLSNITIKYRIGGQVR